MRAFFNQHFVLTEILSKEQGRLYNLLFKYRQQSDYEDFFEIEPDAVRKWLDESKDFVQTVNKLMDCKHKKQGEGNKK